MKLSLARWDDLAGHSAGNWLIRELPGFKLVRESTGWRVDCFPSSTSSLASSLGELGPLAVWMRVGIMQTPCDTWGVDWSPEYALFASLPCGVVGPHPTRAAALFALESHLTPAAKPVIGGIL